MYGPTLEPDHIFFRCVLERRPRVLVEHECQRADRIRIVMDLLIQPRNRH